MAYQVRIGPGILPGTLREFIPASSAAMVVIDAGLARSTVEPVLRVLDARKVRWGVGVVAATEADKSLTTVERLTTEAARLRLERTDHFIALGGGIVCDLAGLAAAVYRRGVPVVQCPTTLLSMVDAAVGGKTGANLTVPGEGPRTRLLKNAVGAFHQPSLVVCDVATLGSLCERELRCGLAECLKHALLGAMLGDRTLMAWLERHLPAIAALEPGVMCELVSRNVRLKARVVSRDERESADRADGGRAALNLGHTFAHALEPLQGLSWPDASKSSGGVRVQVGPLKHGEAVGIGLLAAARLSEGLRLAPKGLSSSIHALLVRIGLPTTLDGLPPAAAIAEAMLDDKKVRAGRVRLVLPVRGGRVRIVENPPAAALHRAIDSLRLRR